ncbi:hypothetical protein B6D60_09730 [candidate division KSB1 bacterium 4484_87]|nr:MAG: hypothetical protein B6D60_09730 [candidate division KSB1 bacterium 4484_87]
MKNFDLKITILEIKGSCPVYMIGENFFLRKGYKLQAGNASSVCMHALGSILPFHAALSHGVSPKELGLNKSDNNFAYVQCPDACERTGGGTVIFEIEVLK